MVEAAAQIDGRNGRIFSGKRSTARRPVRSGIKTEDDVKRTAARIAKLLRKYSISLSEQEFESFVSYTCGLVYHTGSVGVKGFGDAKMPEIDIREQLFVVELLNGLTEETGRKFSENDQRSLEIYLAGKRTIGNSFENDRNFVISEQTDGLALEILQLLSSDFHVDLLTNSDLRMTLNQHLAPLDVRLRFGIPLKNPLLDEIREDYPLAFQMGSIAAGVLEKHYQKTVSDDEIGYLALILQLALEKKSDRRKYNILIVCSNGKGTARLLKYKFQELFETCLNRIYSCDMLEFPDADLSRVDYIFTTQPLEKSFHVPVMKISPLLTDADIRRISKVLMGSRTIRTVRAYFGPERFFAHFPGRNKEEILKNLCERIMEREQVDSDFYEQVIKRETLAQMDLGNPVALPHPNEIASEKSFAYCVVLEEPVMWNGSKTRVLILTSIGRTKEDDAERQKFYEAVAGFALDKDAIDELIQNPEYTTFETLLS